MLKSNESISFFINHVDSDILKLVNDFEAREVRLMINGGNRVAYLFWKAKADSIREVTSLVIHDLLEEMNKIAQLADDTDKDYVWRDSYTRRAQLICHNKYRHSRLAHFRGNAKNWNRPEA